MMERRPLKRTTQALVTRAAQDFQRAVQDILAMAQEDGEVPKGTQADLTQEPVVWLLPIAEPTKPTLVDDSHEQKVQEG